MNEIESGGPGPSMADTVLRSIHEAILATDADDRVVLMNLAAEGLTGWAQSEALGRHLGEVFRVFDELTGQSESWPLFDPRRMALASPETVLTTLVSRTGERVRIEGRATPMRDQERRLVGTAVVFRGVGEGTSGPSSRFGRTGEDADVAELMRLLLDRGPVSSWITDGEGRYAYISPTYRRMIGITDGDPVGKTVFDLFPADVAERYLESTRQVIRTGLPRVLRKSGCRSDGTPGEFLVYKFPMPGPGRPLVCGMAVDITDLREREEEVAQLNEQLTRRVRELQTILDTAPAAVYLARDPQCKVITPNRALAEMLGMPHGENVSKSRDDADQLPFRHFKDGEEMAADRLPMQRAARGEVIEGEVIEVVRGDGSRITVMLNARPVIDEAGAIQGAVGIGVDITAMRRAEQGLREADRRKDEFLAMLAHELRNPLAALTNAAQLLGVDEETRLWATDIIDRQAGVLARLVDDLLDVSRITLGKIELKLETIDASRVIGRAVETVRRFIEERGHELVLSYQPGTLLVLGDEVRLEQILVNLLTNAAKFTPKAGRIWLTATNEGDTVSVSVRDDGSGIPPGKIADMFELFAQGEGSPARSEGGLGIGLTLVKSLVEMHGGSVTATSEGLGQGSEFTVRLPAARRRDVKGEEAAGLAAMNEGSRVLVVDDNVDTALGMQRLLKMMGHDVAIAHGGHEALEVAREHGPAFVLLDIGLPGMDGYEVASRMRQEACCKHTVIVAISGYGQDEDRTRSKEAGIDHHLVKPVDQDALLTLLSAGVDGRG
jgi:PAS domain S-box-containing protein